MSKPAKMPAGYNGWSLIDGEIGIVTLKDVLHNLSSHENGENHEYGKGVLVGVVSCLCACGMDYEDALQLAWQCSPRKEDIHSDRIPECWKDRF